MEWSMVYWHEDKTHIVVVHSHEGVKLYVDGVLVGEGECDAPE